MIAVVWEAASGTLLIVVGGFIVSGFWGWPIIWWKRTSRSKLAIGILLISVGALFVISAALGYVPQSEGDPRPFR